MDGNFVSHRLAVAAVSLGSVESDPGIETIPLASLDKEQLRLSRECRAVDCGEVAPNRFQFVVSVFGVDETELAVR